MGFFPSLIGGIICLLILIALRRRWYLMKKWGGGVWGNKKSLQELEDESGKIVVGLFHPYCNSGGGGERVLWCIVQALQELSPCIYIVIYARKSVGGSEQEILEKAKNRFGVENINREKLKFVYLHTEKLLQAKTFPKLTLLGQSLGSIIVGLEALYRCTPDIYLDTMGYAFTYPGVFLLSPGCRIGTYTHYPTISEDMLRRVYERRPAYNNDELISGSKSSSMIKYLYYRAFAVLYRLVGMFAEVVMVNSSWTKGHIDGLWGIDSTVIFPPCDVEQFSKAGSKVTSKDRANFIVSLGQFRPEKDHKLQINALAALKDKIENEESLKNDTLPKLLLYGGCRDSEDEARVEELKSYAESLKVSDNVEFHLNEPFEELKRVLSTSLYGIHTMWNEHFGIAPVEMLASGVILCAHASGGPKMDIISHGETGYLSSDASEYAEVFFRLIRDDDEESMDAMREKAVQSMRRFSEEKFSQGFKDAFLKFF